MSEQTPGRVRSADGYWEWDGQAWRPVTPVGQPAPSLPSPGDPPVWGAQPAAAPRGGGKAVASLLLGIVSLLVWLVPIVGIPVAVVGLTLGILGLGGSRRGLAIAGVILSAIGVALALVNAVIGAYLGATGQLRFFR